MCNQLYKTPKHNSSSPINPDKADEKKFSNIVCPGCGCCCDDLTLIIKKGRIIEVDNACALGAAKFLNYSELEAIKDISDEELNKRLNELNKKVEKLCNEDEESKGMIEEEAIKALLNRLKESNKPLPMPIKKPKIIKAKKKII